MKTNLKRKNHYLDEKKIRRVRTILGGNIETEPTKTTHSAGYSVVLRAA
jgi:hypothetical protein